MEEAKGFSAVLAPETTSYAADVLCRGVLETTSLAWWLLDPHIDSETRLARSLVYRLNSADQTERAIKALELEPEENRAEYGELPKDVKEAIASVGLTWERRTHEEPRGLFCGEERLPTYTERAASLVAKIWPQRRLPYALLSAVTHGELLGLQRNLVYSRSEGIANLHVAHHPASDMWLWQDTYLVIGALVFTAERAASFLRLDDQLTGLHDWISELDRRLPSLRPGAPDETPAPIVTDEA